MIVTSLWVKKVYLLFQAQKLQQIWQTGQWLIEMDCILWRDWINQRITESQSRQLSAGLVSMLSRIIIILLKVTLLHYKDLVLHFLWPSPGDHWLLGSAFFAQGFSPMRKWTFGAGYNQLLFYSLCFNEDQFTLL